MLKMDVRKWKKNDDEILKTDWKRSSKEEELKEEQKNHNNNLAESNKFLFVSSAALKR